MKYSLQTPLKNTATITEFEVISVMDRLGDKTVVAEISVPNGDSGTICLWYGDAYDQIGQWTDSDVIDAVKAYLVDKYGTS